MSIRFRGQQVGWVTPAPPLTHRRHESPVTGDSQGAIRRASGGCLDFNWQAAQFNTSKGRAYLPVAGHWPTIGQNGYAHTNIDGHVRSLAPHEQALSYQAWINTHGGDVHALNALLKRTGAGAWDYCMTWEQAVQYAKKYDTILTPELKSRAFRYGTLGRHMAAVCKREDYPLWAMALDNMAFAEQKCAAIVKAGGSFSLIFGSGVRGRLRRLARGRSVTRTWAIKPTNLW